MGLVDKIKNLILLCKDLDRYNRGEISYTERDSGRAENLLRAGYIIPYSIRLGTKSGIINPHFYKLIGKSDRYSHLIQILRNFIG